MKKVFMFWIGDHQKINEMVKKIEGQGIEVVVGPSKEDDKYLSENFSYYKLSKDKKIWSFCSDVWRFYVLSKYEGLYIDANEIVGDDFSKMYDEISRYDAAFIKGTSHTLSSSFMYSSGKRKDIFQVALDQYKKFNNKFVRSFPIGPNVITYATREIYHPGFELEVVNNIAFYPYTFMRNEKTYKKVGSASWSKGFNAAVYSQNVEDNFRIHKKVDTKPTKMFYEAKEFPTISVWGLRDEYDSTVSKSDLKELKRIYKRLKIKIYLPQRLIWSQLYRLFTNKRCTEK